tara:strand:- start:557 stop:1768 length:1212 start_codon:yes stop_codon:yes gene_type:complete
MIKQMKKIGNATLYCADCKDVLPLLKDIDACVTDPPYGLSFMGKKWDYDVPDMDIWTQVHNVLKPGAHLLSFFGSRTYHRGAIPIEDAGFEIRDQIMWLYGSGFPKSYNIAKGIEGKLKHGTANWKDWNKLDGDLVDSKIGYSKMQHKQGYRDKDYSEKKHIQNVKFHTKEAQQYEGWGTALKPAHEPIVMARKPFKGSVAENVLEHGTGGINVDECRVGNQTMINRPAGNKGGGNSYNLSVKGMPQDAISTTSDGRFPANIMHDGSEEVQEIFADKARYFYCAKANKKDRDEGLDGFQEVRTGAMSATADNSMLTGSGNLRETKRKNTHPTVKPTELMKYLCRLVTPKGGVVLDPFMGSGSTGKAAIEEGLSFVGIEMDEDYFEIACARIEAAYKQKSLELF